ncbi:MAG: T9SS type A sorting domain-containing protein [Saprospiraceae bacterium]|nr:T9SS type A sorting domain-containing protein [Saprospiraceae bacterium]
MKNQMVLALLATLMVASAAAQQSANNDEFEDASSLSDWQNITDVDYNAEHFEILDINATTSGQLTLQPYTSAWFAQYRGGFIYKDLTGDFVFTSQVTASTTNSSTYSLGGLFLRNPATAMDVTNNNHNYVFLSTGFAATNHPTCPGCSAPHLEVKNTTNSNSDLRVASLPSCMAPPCPVTIRIARLGSTIVCLYRPEGAANFVVHQRYQRGDFDNTIQAGFVAYTDWPKVQTYLPSFHNLNVLNDDLDPDPSDNMALPFTPDITASFAYARFDDVTIPNGLNPATASESELLAFLGYEPDAFLPVTWQGIEARPEGYDVHLIWQTSLLLDHDRFDIEHSRDGIAFERIGTLSDDIASLTETRQFRWTHQQAPSGKNFYRIVQVDSDGQSSRSSVVSAQRMAQQILLYPNPADEILHVLGSSVRSIAIWDLQGRSVLRAPMEGTSISIAALPSGSYFVSLTQAEGNVIWQKLIKQ